MTRDEGKTKGFGSVHADMRWEASRDEKEPAWLRTAPSSTRMALLANAPEPAGMSANSGVIKTAGVHSNDKDMHESGSQCQHQDSALPLKYMVDPFNCNYRMCGGDFQGRLHQRLSLACACVLCKHAQRSYQSMPAGEKINCADTWRKYESGENMSQDRMVREQRKTSRGRGRENKATCFDVTVNRYCATLACPPPPSVMPC